MVRGPIGGRVVRFYQGVVPFLELAEPPHQDSPGFDQVADLFMDAPLALAPPHSNESGRDLFEQMGKDDRRALQAVDHVTYL